MKGKGLSTSSLILAMCVIGAVPALAQHDRNDRDWIKLQAILEKIHGIATEPPNNLVTPKYTSGAR